MPQGNGDFRWNRVPTGFQLGGEVVLVAFFGALLAAKLALRLGQDASWDLLNYHYYNPWAFVNGRIDLDIQPGMRQSYFNPLIDVPFYLLLEHTTPKLASAMVAAWQGMLLPLTYLIARLSLFPVASTRGWRRSIVAIACCLGLATIGFLSPLSLYELGTTAGDNTSAVFILAGVACLVAALPRRAGMARTRFAMSLALSGGVLAGMGVGLKLTSASFALGLAIALLLVRAPWRVRLRLLVMLGVGGVAGTLATGGHWWLRMWVMFENPVFPQLNHVFRSPWIDAAPFTDPYFLGDSLVGKVFFPLAYNEVFGTEVGGRRFYDLRVGILLLLGLACVAATVTRAARRRTLPQPSAAAPVRAAWFAWFVVASYAAWVVVFAFHRYALLLEVLAPLAAVCLLIVLGLRRRALVLASVVVLGAMVLSFNAQRSPRVYWSDSFFDVKVPAGDYEGAMIVQATHQPTGFMLPSFPASARFVHVSGNLYYEGRHATPEARHDNAMGDHLRRTIQGHEGRFFVLYTPTEPKPLADARYFGLRFDPAAGRRITSKIGPDVPILIVEARMEPGAD